MRRSRNLTAILAALLLAVVPWMPAQQDSDAQKPPLDLPAGGKGSTAEDTTGEVVTFYGSDFEGEAFFWCLDHSGSMGWAGEIEILKQEMLRSITQLSERSEFGIVAVADEVGLWKDTPQLATLKSKDEAVAFVAGLKSQGGSCLTQGVKRALDLAAKSSAKNKAIILVGDGPPACGDETAESALAAINEANVHRVPIHGVYLSASKEGMEFYHELAKESGGTLMLVPVNR